MFCFLWKFACIHGNLGIMSRNVCTQATRARMRKQGYVHTRSYIKFIHRTEYFYHTKFNKVISTTGRSDLLPGTVLQFPHDAELAEFLPVHYFMVFRFFESSLSELGIVNQHFLEVFFLFYQCIGRQIIKCKTHSTSDINTHTKRNDHISGSQYSTNRQTVSLM